MCFFFQNFFIQTKKCIQFGKWFPLRLLNFLFSVNNYISTFYKISVGKSFKLNICLVFVFVLWMIQSTRQENKQTDDTNWSQQYFAIYVYIWCLPAQNSFFIHCRQWTQKTDMRGKEYKRKIEQKSNLFLLSYCCSSEIIAIIQYFIFVIVCATFCQ